MALQTYLVQSKKIEAKQLEKELISLSKKHYAISSITLDTVNNQAELITSSTTLIDAIKKTKDYSLKKLPLK